MYPSDYFCRMFTIETTEEFDKWLRKLKDLTAKNKIVARLIMIEESGNFGDCKPVGEGFSELRIPWGKGYRVYFKQEEDKVIFVLYGGDKSTQKNDIIKAKKLWEFYNGK